MKSLRSFDDYGKEGIVRRGSPDKERAKSLIAESERKLASLKERLEKIGIKDENANDYVEYCYDIMMQMVRAKMYLDGHYASGKGAHEAEVAYLEVLGFSEKEVRFADQIRYFRNGILYYGSSLDAEYAEKVRRFLEGIRPKLLRALGKR